jgi:hypothetical protein
VQAFFGGLPTAEAQGGASTGNGVKWQSALTSTLDRHTDQEGNVHSCSLLDNEAWCPELDRCIDVSETPCTDDFRPYVKAEELECAQRNLRAGAEGEDGFDSEAEREAARALGPGVVWRWCRIKNECLTQSTDPLLHCCDGAAREADSAAWRDYLGREEVPPYCTAAWVNENCRGPDDAIEAWAADVCLVCDTCFAEQCPFWDEDQEQLVEGGVHDCEVYEGNEVFADGWGTFRYSDVPEFGRLPETDITPGDGAIQLERDEYLQSLSPAQREAAAAAEDSKALPEASSR